MGPKEDFSSVNIAVTSSVLHPIAGQFRDDWRFIEEDDINDMHEKKSLNFDEMGYVMAAQIGHVCRSEFNSDVNFCSCDDPTQTLPIGDFVHPIDMMNCSPEHCQCGADIWDFDVQWFMETLGFGSHLGNWGKSLFSVGNY